MFVFFGRFVRLFSVGYAGGNYLLFKIRFWIFFGFWKFSHLNFSK